MAGIKNKSSHTMWFTDWERPPDVLSNHQLVISIQLAALAEQLTTERDNSMCFHDHKVGRLPNNEHNGKQWWSWTHCNPLLKSQRTVMCAALCTVKDICLYLYHYTPITDKLHNVNWE